MRIELDESNTNKLLPLTETLKKSVNKIVNELIDDLPADVIIDKFIQMIRDETLKKMEQRPKK